MRKEHESIRNQDYRFQALTTLSEDWVSPFTKEKHEAGTSVMLTAILSRGNGTFNFGIPNMTALFIDFSYKLWEESSKYLQGSDFEDMVSRHVPENTAYPKVHADLFDFMEKRMGAIVFAYSALEAFANEYIPDDYVFEKERQDSKCTEKYTKEQIENFLSLDVKLGEILPDILGVKSPKGKSVWSGYKQLKRLRDRIIHLKSKDRKSAEIDAPTIWKELLNAKYPNFALEAKNMIGHFLEKQEEKPRWFENFPYA